MMRSKSSDRVSGQRDVANYTFGEQDRHQVQYKTLEQVNREADERLSAGKRPADVNRGNSTVSQNKTVTTGSPRKIVSFNQSREGGVIRSTSTGPVRTSQVKQSPGPMRNTEVVKTSGVGQPSPQVRKSEVVKTSGVGQPSTQLRKSEVVKTSGVGQPSPQLRKSEVVKTSGVGQPSAQLRKSEVVKTSGVGQPSPQLRKSEVVSAVRTSGLDLNLDDSDN